MRAISTRLDRVRRDDRGISLVELLVVMMLSGLVMAIAMTMFVNVARSTVKAEDTRRSTAEAANIMDVLTTDIRSATQIFGDDVTTAPILAAANRSLTIITYTDAGPTFGQPYQIRYRVVDGIMWQDRWAPNGIFPRTDQPSSRRVLGEAVGDGRIFSFFTSAGAQIRAGGGTLTADERSAIAAIEVLITVTAADTNEPVELINLVGMPNMGVTRDD